MRILIEIHKELFNDPSMIKEKSEINPLKPYYISHDIVYNEKEHWIIYDFVKKKIYSKSFSREFFMFEMTNNYTEIKKENNVNNINIILTDNEMSNYLLVYETNLKVEIGLTQKKILVILDDSFNFKNDKNDKNFNHIFYCIYQTYMKNEIIIKKSDEIEKIIYNPGLVAELNWVWFRKSKINTFLDPKILKRAYTWINNNNNQEDNFKFHLWTNLENKEELVEYFKEADPNQEFINNHQVIIHFYGELIELVSNFFSKNINDSSLLEDYKNILDNSLEKSVMVLKTDSIRCIILAMNGGWYADFNDTYSFCALKYIINNDDSNNDSNNNSNNDSNNDSNKDSNLLKNKDCMYFGSDEKGFLNNYILYSSKDNLEWKEKTIQIIKNSIDIYNNLFDANNINNIYLVNEFNIIKNDLCNLLEKQIEKNEEIYIVEIIINQTKKWRNQLFKIDNNFNKFGISFNDKTIINLFNIIINKNSILGTELKNQFNSELTDNLRIINISQFCRKKKVYWNNCNNIQKPVKFRPRIDEINLLRNFMIDFSLISNSMIYINIQVIMKKMNIGCLMTECNSNNSNININNFLLLDKNIFQISNCYVFNAFTFLTVIGHLGDGTCTGQDKNYKLYNKLL